MEIKLGLKSGVYVVSIDSFNLLNTDQQITSSSHCRDGFHNIHHVFGHYRLDKSLSYHKQEFLQDRFVFGSQRPTVIEAEIHRIEKQFGLTELTQFYLTNLSRGHDSQPILIIPSKFWFEYYLRFSLFSLLVRGLDKQSELNKADYALRNTIQTVEYFLQGNTVPIIEEESFGCGNRYRHQDQGWCAKTRLVPPEKALAQAARKVEVAA